VSGPRRMHRLFLLAALAGCGSGEGASFDAGVDADLRLRWRAAVAKALEDAGNKILAGGGKAPEKLIDTTGGGKNGRRPDIIYEKPDGSWGAVNVGKTKADGTPVPREVKALEDLNGPGGLPTDFVPYDR